MPRKNGQEFPKTLAAGIAYRDADKKLWQHAWALGDALISECGPPGASGVRTGSKSKLARAAKFLREKGVEYSTEHLRELRQVASAFPAGDRSPAVPWTVYRVAGNVEVFNAAKTSAQKEAKKLTVGYLKKYQTRMKREQEREQQERRKDSKGPRSDPERESATLKLLENAKQARELGIDALKAVKKYPELKLEEVVAIVNNIEVWGKILDTHPRSDVLQAAE